MARFTSAYASFSARESEVTVLIRSARTVERRDPIEGAKYVGALCRAAIVLLSSHVEGYVKELGELCVTRIIEKRVDRQNLKGRFFYHISKDMIKEIAETTDHDKIGDKIDAFLTRDYDLHIRLGHFPNPIPYARFSKGFSNPSHDKVMAFLGRFGADNLKTDMRRDLKADYTVLTNQIDHIVGLRNSVAHGDLAARATPRDVHQMQIMARKYVASVDKCFANWARENLCGLR